MRIGEAAAALGVHIDILRRWKAQGRLAAERHRQYDLAKLRPEMFRTKTSGIRETIAYARVSVKAELALAQRVFRCGVCGHEADRDLNAARNLERLAASSAVTACGEDRSGAGRKPRVKRASVKQEHDDESAEKVSIDDLQAVS